MLSVCIDRNVLGTDRHLLVNGVFQWIDDVPTDTWHLNGYLKHHSNHCLDTLAKLSDVVLPLSPPERFVKSMSLFSGSLGSVPVPWSKVMPTEAHRSFVKNLVSSAADLTQTGNVAFYSDTWVKGNHVLGALRPTVVDVPTWRQLVLRGEGNVHVLQSFAPDIDGFAQPVTYDRFATLTGRLTVASGPQILTVKRVHRKILKSRYGDKGGIYALDFAALEARVLLYEHGRQCPDKDLYGALAKEMGRERNIIKEAVISELYGSTKQMLGRRTGIQGKELHAFVRHVKVHFRTDELLARVKAQFVDKGYMTNRYGRRVRVDQPLDRLFIAHYGQSTGVDVTMLGFYQALERLEKTAPMTVPLFVLHDAMLLDVPDDELDEVRKVDRVQVKGYVQSWPLKLERVA